MFARALKRWGNPHPRARGEAGKMRRFRAPGGLPWDAVVGRESWGTLYALFLPAGVGRTEPVRQALLASAGYEQAQQELEQMDEAALQGLFAASRPRADT
jgi:hypothetical protein